MSNVRKLFDQANEHWKKEARWRLESLAPSATSEELGTLEREAHVTLPSEYKELLRIHNGHTQSSSEYRRFEIGHYWHSDWVFSSTAAVLEAWQHKNSMAEEMFSGTNKGVEEGIKPMYWNKHWLPIFNDSVGNSLCLDFDPATSGAKGQLIFTDWERGEHKVVAPTFLEGLETIVNKMTGVVANEAIQSPKLNLEGFYNMKHRGLLFALNREDNTPQFDPDDQGPIDDVTVDPDHPETIQHLSLPEYYHLVMMNDQAIPYGDSAMVQEGFSETMQNFKSFFQRSIGKEESYIDSLWERYKALAPRIQALTDKPAHPTPVSLFGDYASWFEAGGKLIQTPQQILTEVTRLMELNTAIEKHFLPSFAAEIKYAMDCLALGATDIDGAYKKVYVINKVIDPMKGFESLLTVTGSVKLGSGKTIPSKESQPYLGSLILQAYQLGDSAGLNIDRGHEMLTDLSPKFKNVDKIQLRQGSRDELKNIVTAATKALEIANSYLDKMLHAESNMLADKVNSFENSHRNWRQYPQEERRKIVTIMHAGDTTINRVNVVHDVLFLTRKSLRAVERYVEMCAKRFA